MMKKHKKKNTELSSPQRPRKRQRRGPPRQCRVVRFSESQPQTFTFDNFEAMTETQVQQSREQIWYTRSEFDAFLADRLHTIRMWRAVQGNTSLIEPYYCTRGLEIYASAALNSTVLAARHAHAQAVLQEQARQRSITPSANIPLNWNALAKVVEHRSAWALQQASRLALRDALEAQQQDEKVWETTSRGVPTTNFNNLTTAPFKMPTFDTSTANMDGGLPSEAAARRLSLSMMGSSSANSLYAMTNRHRRRNTVDVHKLKEMNRQFLKSVVTQQQGNATTNTAPKQQRPMSSTTAAHSNSLALMLVRGRRMAALNNGGVAAQAPSVRRSLAGLAQEASFSLGIEGGGVLGRESLHHLIRESTADL